jgi:nitroreductase
MSNHSDTVCVGLADNTANEHAPSLLDVMQARRAIRAFLPDPVPRQTLEQILQAARWAPSGVNMQPWRVAVVQGAALRALSEALIAAQDAPQGPDYRYYPEQWQAPYNDRRMQLGQAIYATYGRMKRADRGRAQITRNLRFFGAPAALLVLLDRGMAQGAWLDAGMFVQSMMLAAESLGLQTCPQVSIAEHPDIVRRTLQLGADQLVLCSVAVGHADWHDPLNTIPRHRAAVAEFTQFFD